jgi:2-polyprenyl-3-methyl-5-hydroxy-6-metoxy-1,4-benzoquinol methylase
MHSVILTFAKKHAAKFTGRVLDVGSFNVNGQLRDVLPITLGVDMSAGPGVDQVCNASDLLATFGPESFDCVCSADALEHIEDWRAAMENMWGVLRTGGVLFLTMANPRKGRHNYPNDWHRIPMPDFVRMFGDNQVLDTFEGGPSMGAVVIKAADLDLSITPIKVK